MKVQTKINRFSLVTNYRVQFHDAFLLFKILTTQHCVDVVSNTVQALAIHNFQYFATPSYTVK